jgi:HK97 family phage major capsid protein
MSATATPETPQKPAEIIKGLQDKTTAQDAKLAEQDATIAELKTTVGELKTKQAQTPIYGGVGGIVGGIPGDSEGYSIIKAARYASGRIDYEKAKYEVDTSTKLAEIYKSCGWPGYSDLPAARRMLIPFATKLIPRETSEADRLVGELKTKMIAGADKVDQDEVRWIQKKLGLVTKDLGTLSDTAGGVLVGFPTLGELIDMQRNVEVFAQAGASEIGLPPNGRIQYPKLTNSTTASWIPEGQILTESTPSTGYLDLQAKKLGIWVDLNNELIRFGTISAEAMVRTDMAKVAALKMDLAQLEGTGGSQIKGLITYPSAASWTTGTDPLLAYTVTGNTIQISDAADMEALMPDTAGEPTAWVMRRNLWAKIRNRRASSVSSADSAGQFLASVIRDVSTRIPLEWDGTKVVRSTQVSNTRGTGAQTYVILGYFPDWITARFGALEFLSTMVSDQAFKNDQTQIRCIQHVDAGPRHASSFVFADSITIQ